MPQSRETHAKAQIDDLGQRIHKRIRELEERGSFSNLQTKHLQQAKERHAMIQARVKAAIHQGEPWETIKVEALRDYEAIFEGLEHFDDELDADQMRASE